MLILRSVTALDVDKRGVGLDDTDVAQILESTHVLLLSAVGAIDGGRSTVLPLQPASAECQRAERFVDVR